MKIIPSNQYQEIHSSLVQGELDILFQAGLIREGENVTRALRRKLLRQIKKSRGKMFFIDKNEA